MTYKAQLTELITSLLSQDPLNADPDINTQIQTLRNHQQFKPLLAYLNDLILPYYTLEGTKGFLTNQQARHIVVTLLAYVAEQETKQPTSSEAFLPEQYQLNTALQHLIEYTANENVALWYNEFMHLDYTTEALEAFIEKHRAYVKGLLDADLSPAFAENPIEVGAQSLFSKPLRFTSLVNADALLLQIERLSRLYEPAAGMPEALKDLTSMQAETFHRYGIATTEGLTNENFEAYQTAEDDVSEAVYQQYMDARRKKDDKIRSAVTAENSRQAPFLLQLHQCIQTVKEHRTVQHLSSKKRDAVDKLCTDLDEKIAHYRAQTPYDLSQDKNPQIRQKFISQRDAFFKDINNTVDQAFTANKTLSKLTSIKQLIKNLFRLAFVAVTFGIGALAMKQVFLPRSSTRARLENRVRRAQRQVERTTRSNAIEMNAISPPPSSKGG